MIITYEIYLKIFKQFKLQILTTNSNNTMKQIAPKHFVALIVLIICLILDGQSATLTFAGDEGSWLSKHQVPEYKYACGAQLYVQAPMKNGDEVAANGVRLIACDGVNWQNQDIIQAAANSGTWRGMKMCPVGQFVSGFKVRYQRGGSDNSGLNGLIIICRSPHNPASTEVEVDPGYWGEWTPAYVSQNEFVVSLKIRIVPAKPSTRIDVIHHQHCKRNWLGRKRCHTTTQHRVQKIFDNTGLNGIEFQTKPYRKVRNISINYHFPPLNLLTPEVFQQYTTVNAGNAPSKKTIQFSKNKTYQRSWILTNSIFRSSTSTRSFSFTAGVSLSVSVPFISVGASLEIGRSNTFSSTTSEGQQITFGETQTFSISNSHKLQVDVPACTTKIIQSLIRATTAVIPFTITIAYEDGSQRFAYGLYKGVIVSAIQEIIKDGYKPSGC